MSKAQTTIIIVLALIIIAGLGCFGFMKWNSNETAKLNNQTNAAALYGYNMGVNYSINYMVAQSQQCTTPITLTDYANRTIQLINIECLGNGSMK